MKKQANIVVIGAGIIGVSVAFHLAELGVKDILLIDKGDLDENDGSTSHAPGGLRVLTPSDFFTTLGSRSAAHYDSLPRSDGKEHFFKNGLLQIASSQERFDSYKRLHEMGMTMGIPSELLTPEEAAKMQPLLDPKEIVGGFAIRDSGVVKTSLIATILRKQAEDMGSLRSLSNTLVTDIQTNQGRVSGVTTNHPDYEEIECEQVVICTNIWAPVLCEKLGVSMPLFPGEHQYIYTEEVEFLKDYSHKEVMTPITAMDDISIYFRQHFDKIGIGSYHHAAKLVDPHKLGKEAKMPFTPEDFETAWGLMQKHLPPLNSTKVSHGFNGMFSFTVDGFPVVGESHIKGLWTNVGAWLSFASELGLTLARWMTTGDPGMDMRQADIKRFHPYQSNPEYLSRQSKYFYEIGFDIVHPSQVASSVRNLKHEPFHDRMEALGAEWVPNAGVETALWYNANEALVDKYSSQIPEREGWGAMYWSRIQGAEHLAVRESVGLVDWSAGIGPIEVSGDGSSAFLNYLCTTKIDKAVGSISYTLWLTENGGIKRDVTIYRKAEDTYWVLTGTANMPAEILWMQEHLTDNNTVQIQSLSEQYCSIAIWGPKSRSVLEKVSKTDLSNEAFPFYTAQSIDVGMVTVEALRLSYAGELGWELYAPVSFGMQLWDTLWQAGEEHGIIACGLGAVMSMRLEKGYRLYGADMHTEHNPYEVGLGRMINFTKEKFVGKDAILKLKEQPLTKKLVCLTFDDPNAVFFGFEPVLVGDEVIGHITSGNYGYSVGKFIAYALIDNSYASIGTEIEVQDTLLRFKGTIAKEPLFDTKMLRLKA